MGSNIKITNELEEYIINHSYKLNPIQREIIKYNKTLGERKKMQISLKIAKNCKNAKNANFVNNCQNRQEIAKFVQKLQIWKIPYREAFVKISHSDFQEPSP